MVYILKLALLLTMAITTTTLNQMLANMNAGYAKTFQQILEHIEKQGKANNFLYGELSKAQEKINSFEKKICGINATMMRQEKEIESLRQQLQEKENPPKAATSDSSKKNHKRTLFCMG